MYKWFLFLLPFSAFAQQPAYDILIRNGKIVDGTGNGWYYGNVGVKDGKIVKAGRAVLDSTASVVIDATGLIVAPGFIDVHTHIEGDEDKDPTAASFIYDGVITVSLYSKQHFYQHVAAR